MPKSLATLTGTRKLSDVARHLVLPDGIASTGWPDIRSQCLALGITFEAWQDGIGRGAFAKRADGIYAASVGGTVLSIPRQVGKTYLVGGIAFALCLLTPLSKVIWTAHHSNTADETFESMSAMAQMSKVAPHIRAVRSTNGQQRIVFRNGSRIEFGARERGFGRGKQKVSLLVLDEAQILTDSALENMVPSMNRADNPMMFMMGTPPRPQDPGEVFTNKRARSLAGTAKDTFFIEISADDDALPDDRAQWVKANPSYPHFTPDSAMLRMRESFTEDGFRREALGIWDAVDANSGAFPAVVWYRQALKDVGKLTGPVAAIDAVQGLDQAASLVICGLADEHQVVHVARNEPESSQGFVDAVDNILKPRGIHDVGLDFYGENQNLVPLFEAAGYRVHQLNQADMRNACTGFSDAVINQRVWHRNQPPLNRAVSGSGARKSDAGLTYSQLKSSTDQTPLRAAAVAWALYQSGVAADYDVLQSAY